jgi:hypothetical protein
MLMFRHVVNLGRSTEEEMKRIAIILLLAIMAGCTHNSGETTPSAPPARKSPVTVQAPKKNLKEFLLGERRLLEGVNSWSFKADGTFSAAALTGRKSWSLMGTWSEQSDGSILLEGVETNAFEPKRVYPPYKTTYNGMFLIDQATGEKTAVQFRKDGE